MPKDRGQGKMKWERSENTNRINTLEKCAVSRRVGVVKKEGKSKIKICFD